MVDYASSVRQYQRQHMFDEEEIYRSSRSNDREQRETDPYGLDDYDDYDDDDWDYED